MTTIDAKIATVFALLAGAAACDQASTAPGPVEPTAAEPAPSPDTPSSATPTDPSSDDGPTASSSNAGADDPSEATPSGGEDARKHEVENGSQSDDPGTSEPTSEPAEQARAKPSLPGQVHKQVDDSCGKGPGVGSKVKSFKLQTPNGKSISPGMFRGRVVLLNFWGTWCKPCLEELPEFDRLYRRYRKHGLSLVAVATDEDPAAVQAFLDKRKIAAKVAIGGEATASAYGAQQFPFTFVVDADGVIRGSYSGYKEKCMGKLEQDIREELEKIASK